MRRCEAKFCTTECKAFDHGDPSRANIELFPFRRACSLYEHAPRNSLAALWSPRISLCFENSRICDRIISHVLLLFLIGRPPVDVADSHLMSR